MQQSLQNQKEKKDHGKDDPALSKVIERNIRTIIHLRTKADMNATCKVASPTPSPPFLDGWFSFICISYGLGYGFCLTQEGSVCLFLTHSHTDF